MIRIRPLLSLTFLTAALASRQLAAQPTPIGPEVQVNDEWADDNRCPKLGVAANHSFEIAWGARFERENGEVKARRYNADGSPAQGSSVLVATGLEADYEVLAVSPVSTGFRVLMTEDSDRLRFFRRRIAPDGVPAAGDPRPVGSPKTEWVLSGPGDLLFAGRYDRRQRLLTLQKVDSLGRPAGRVYALNSRPFALVGAPVLAPLSDGGWVVAYAGTSVAGAGSPARQVIRARRFNAEGDPVGPDFDVNSSPGGPPKGPPFLAGFGLLVAGGPSGQFAVAWDVEGPGLTSTVRTRFFNAANAAGPETTVASGRRVYGPDSMAFDDSGRLLLVWLMDSDAQPGFPSFGLWARLVGADGLPVGSPFRPESKASADYPSLYCSSVGWSGDSWLITWKGFYLEDEGNAIFLRRFR